MITTKQRATLRSFSNNLPDIVHIGKDGITDNVVKQVEDNLTARELIKIKVITNCELTPREVCDVLASKVGAEPVSVVGSKIVLYRYSNKQGIKHYL